ncbi:putative disease resistance protein RGA3 [Carex rostrata]
MAMVPYAHIANTINSLDDLINSKITKVLGITNEAQKLLNRLEKVLDVLEDAERKKIRDGDVKRWLVELREVVFESEKVIDYCRIEAHNTRKKEKQTQQQVAACPRLLASCFSKSGLRDMISKGVRTLNIKMKAILKEKPQLNLKQVIIGNTSTAAPTQNSSQSLPSNTCIGATIETDTDYLVNILTNEETNKEAEGSHHLIAIVGVGGIGKTTLARKIFNDERIRGSFDIRIWISQSSSLKDSALLAKIIDAAGGNPSKSTTRACLEPKLATTVARKRFLVVLDDVSDGSIWENLLKAPLQASARGSRILVTTREENVAIQMGASYVHDVKRLSPEEGWLLLRETSSLEEEDESDILTEIGLNISEKCNGLPLAIKIVGGILKRKEPTIKEWQAISESQTWSMEGLLDGIPRVLYLGYDDLPLNLKQCFLYCSLFPKNFCIAWHDLIKKWVSEGFVVKRDGATLEEIGEEYYKELVQRYLIYPEKECDDDTERCKMHDCLVNMARLLSPEEISVDEINKLGEVTFRPCYVSLVSEGMKIIPEEIKTKEKLRTLLLSKNPLKDDGLRDLFTRLKLLRVLDISETSIEVIPDTLRNLLHLRYLNLSRTKIKELPESIGYLPFLQFLLLQECKRLHSLPKGIENLKSLRNFDLTGTTINRFLFRIGKLVNLRSLDFIANTKLEKENKAWSLGELKNLNKLRSLCILQIDKTRDLDEAKEALLGTKPCLKELELSCNEATPLENPIIIEKINSIFDELCPPPCLETLKIINYFGTKYPSWLSIDSLSNLQQLELINCQFCQTLPPLGELPKLVFLYIANASDLRDIGPDITGTGQEIAFPKLEKLHIQSLNNLESWTGLERPDMMPCLKAFQLESCPEIRFLPPCIKHSKSLKELRIIDCKSLKLIKNLTGIKELSVWNTPNLRKISNLTSLEDLSISHSPNLEIIKNVNLLKSVQIFDYDLEAIPRWLKTHDVQIQSLDLAGTEQMLQRCLINGPDWDIIRDITRVYGHSNTCTYFLYNRNPFNLETNLSVPVPVPQHEENSSTTETVAIETILEETEEIFPEEESPINDEIVPVAVNTRSKEPSASISINQSYPPTTTYTDNIPVNMLENIFGLSNSDNDAIGTSTGSLVRRRRRKNNITEVASIDADKNAHTGNPIPSNLVFNFEFGMPNNESATKEKNAGQNDIDSLSSDFNSLGNSNMLNSKTETLGRQSMEQYATEKSRGSFTSSLLYSDPNVSTNEEKLIESTFTLNSRIETLSRQNSENQSSEDTSLSSNFSTDLESEVIQTQRMHNFDSILKPVRHEGIFEEANYFVKPIKKASSPAVAFAGSTTSEIVSTCKSEVNDKSSIKERPKDYLIVILMAVLVMQLFLIIWLVL